MSIGYETQIAPINTLAFYNAIANNGRLVQPRFVKQVVKDGMVVEEFEPVVLKEQIAKPSTIKTMQTVLRHVVSQGLGSRAGSSTFQVAGKTGTAQVSDNVYNYHSGLRCHWLSFCGYFPADNPRYSCIVCVKTTTGPPSGGLVSGTVFHNIAEGVMAKDVRLVASSACDDKSVFVPDVKKGSKQAADYVLHQLDIADALVASAETENGKMPDMRGMGASDAVYMLEKMGLKVHVSGIGEVKSQSIPAGTKLQGGMSVQLQLGS